jgi:hypothetical protein
MPPYRASAGAEPRAAPFRRRPPWNVPWVWRRWNSSEIPRSVSVCPRNRKPPGASECAMRAITARICSAAACIEMGTGEEGGLLREEPDDRFRHLVGACKVNHENRGQYTPVLAAGPHIPDHLRIGDARPHRIDPNALCGDLPGKAIVNASTAAFEAAYADELGRPPMVAAMDDTFTMAPHLPFRLFGHRPRQRHGVHQREADCEANRIEFTRCRPHRKTD